MRIGTLVFLAFVLTVAYGGYSVYQSVQHIQLAEAKVVGIRNLTLKGITLDGELTINNPGFVTVTLENVTYDVLIKENRNILGSGFVPSGSIQAKQNVIIPFTQSVSWKESLNALLESKSLVLVVDGTAYISTPITLLSLPFKTEVDAMPYLRAVAQEAATNAFEQLGSFIEGLTA